MRKSIIQLKNVNFSGIFMYANS